MIAGKIVEKLPEELQFNSYTATGQQVGRPGREWSLYIWAAQIIPATVELFNFILIMDNIYTRDKDSSPLELRGDESCAAIADDRVHKYTDCWANARGVTWMYKNTRFLQINRWGSTKEIERKGVEEGCIPPALSLYTTMAPVSNKNDVTLKEQSVVESSCRSWLKGLIFDAKL